ncbi:hypothetical protein MJO55_08605 [Mycolicibacterium rufum]|uniref:Proline rich protein n=1 Tax=Mycolicibacterium rufum TaxID=318424 RepID=A0A9X3BPF0_9MYCO|nr:hypothetical protein [Mycolicibacterium rufum]MCV7069176.1 hypothetical protein [Mycolicibacterium rufum]ULP38467.1 hypothetical protein MJO55_08605 [Mycolicibacterium rufum]
MKWTDWIWAPQRPGSTRGWPNYIFGGRMRTSTAALILAFFALFWVNQNFQPAPSQKPADQTQVVPPGFVPDPNYTWVPRTNVETRAPESTTRTTTTRTTTTTPAPTTSSSPSDTTPPTSTDGTEPGGTNTTVIDPDGPGPLGPQTFTQAPPTLAPTTVAPPGVPPATTAAPPR